MSKKKRKPKKMKRKSIILLIFACLVFGVTNVNAQKCKFKEDKTDPFTGKLQRMTYSPIIPAYPKNTEFWFISFMRDGDDYSIQILFGVTGELNTNFEKGDSVMFKFANNEVITCYGKETASPKTYIDRAHIIRTSYNCYYLNLTPQNMITFSTSLITYAKININEKKYQTEVTEKLSKDIMMDAICIMK